MTREKFEKLSYGEIKEFTKCEFSSDTYCVDPQKLKYATGEEWFFGHYQIDYKELFKSQFDSYHKSSLYDILIKHRPELFL